MPGVGRVDGEIGAPSPVAQLADVAVGVVGPVGELKAGGVERPIESESFGEPSPGIVETLEPLSQGAGLGEGSVLGDEPAELDRGPEPFVEPLGGRGERRPVAPTGAALRALLDATGIRCSQRLGDIVAELPEFDEHHAVRLLGGAR